MATIEKDFVKAKNQNLRFHRIDGSKNGTPEFHFKATVPPFLRGQFWLVRFCGLSYEYRQGTDVTTETYFEIRCQNVRWRCLYFSFRNDRLGYHFLGLLMKTLGHFRGKYLASLPSLSVKPWIMGLQFLRRKKT